MSRSIRKQKHFSLVERVFDNPKIIGQGEYTTIYDFLLDLDERDDPEFMVVVLEEFSRWAQYMIEKMRKSMQPEDEKT